MHTLLIVHCAVTWMLAGLIWTVQLVLYPLFPLVGKSRELFAAYHWRHMVGITSLVLPLVILESASAAWLIGAGERNGWLLWSLAPLWVNVLSTACIQAPLHLRLRLSHDSNAKLYQKLVTTNWLRTACWTLRGILVGVVLTEV